MPFSSENNFLLFSMFREFFSLFRFRFLYPFTKSSFQNASSNINILKKKVGKKSSKESQEKWRYFLSAFGVKLSRIRCVFECRKYFTDVSIRKDRKIGKSSNIRVVDLQLKSEGKKGYWIDDKATVNFIQFACANIFPFFSENYARSAEAGKRG